MKSVLAARIVQISGILETHKFCCRTYFFLKISFMLYNPFKLLMAFQFFDSAGCLIEAILNCINCD
jgi:hypothetical protein